MKKIILAALSAGFMLACNNSADTESNADKNNMNTKVYDSATGNRAGDTSSYERMPNKISDSMPQ